MSKAFNPAKIPSLNPQEIKAAFSLFFRFNRYILRYWKLEAILLILGNCSLFFTLINPWLAKVILDKGILGKNIVVFIKYTALSAINFLLIFIITKGSGFLSNYVRIRVRADLLKNVFSKMRKLSLGFFQSRSTAEAFLRVNVDIVKSADIIVDTLPEMVLNLCRLFYTTAVILFINYKIFILVLIYYPVLLLRSKFLVKRAREFAKVGFSKSQGIYNVLSDFLSHIYFIKASGSAGRVLRKYFRIFSNILRLQVKDLKWQFSSDVIETFSRRVFFGLVGFLGTILVIKGRLTLGSLGAIVAYLSMGVGAYVALVASARGLIINSLCLDRVTEILDAEIEVKEKTEAKDMVLPEGKIEFREVVFGYQKDKYILDRISFIFPPQSKIAVVGHSGCGKTTIVNLILRLYDVNRGVILLDDYDIRDLRFKSIYNSIAVSLQEPFLFNDSVKDNIGYYQEQTMDEIIHAARVACAHDFILQLPDGYETVVGENACKISQGQKQRIAIARAIIRRPKILILDEAMSSLDSETEDKIIGNIKSEFIDSTMIVVSHRFSTASKMDLVYFLESPLNMEFGTHQELLNKNLRYRQLFASQIESDEDPYGIKVAPGNRI
jgi:ATP-binding cassette subfamily B protein